MAFSVSKPGQVRSLRGLSLAAVVAVLAVPAAASGDSYAYGYGGVEVSAQVEGTLSDGSGYAIYYRESVGTYTDTRYVNLVDPDVAGQLTACVQRRVSSKRTNADCGHAPLSGAAIDKIHLSGATFTISAPSATRRGSDLTAR